MNRKIIFVLLVSLIGSAAFAEAPLVGEPDLNVETFFLWNYTFSDTGSVEYRSIMELAAAGDPDSEVEEIPAGIRNNKYFLQSVKLTNMANQAFEEGDYDLSAEYAAESIRYANLSDEYVQLQLKIKECDDAIAAARSRLDYADSVNASARYPGEYSRAQASYNEARGFRSAEKWDEAIAAANRVLSALALVTEEDHQPEQQPIRLPSQYTVRPWNISKDCLWNIAGRPWVYNDPKQWKLLYEANKARMPKSDNPDLIHPGMVLTIPSIKGESRDGMWDAETDYPAFK